MTRARKITVRSTVVALALSLCGACSAAVWQGIAAGLDGAATGMQAASGGLGLPPGKLMIFGGPNHSTYLGCLSCNEYASDSLFNEFSSHGSSYGAASIFNAYGSFGSKYSSTSACNPYATDPPVIVDGSGKYYGRLTVNRARSDGPPSAELRAWLAGVCK